MQRVGRIDDADVAAAYDAIGRDSPARIERLLPSDWSWAGKRVLDFGCGAGRTLRHFLPEAGEAEFYGCDIDAASIEWLAQQLSPPLLVFRNGEEPGLPQRDDFFDLVYALSVFTHVTDRWAPWMVELQRVVKPGGLLIATFLNEAHWPAYGDGPWDEDRIGMNVTKKWNPWDRGGPIVFLSEWWIRAHWGRAFDLVAVERRDPDSPEGQGAALLRAKAERPTVAELERPADDPRELAAARHNVEQLHREAEELFREVEWRKELEQKRAAVEAERDRLRAEVERLRGTLDAVSRSRSWRLTAPLRGAVAAVRKRSTLP